MQHVLITGAASGIGLEVARSYAARGDQLTIVDRDATALEAVAPELQAAGATSCRSLAVDLTTIGAPASIIGQAWNEAPVDVLVSSAGVYPATPFLELDESKWDFVQGINTRTPTLLAVELAKRAIPEDRKPNIVNISSGAALRARPGAAPYSTSKAALEAATKAAALELGRYGIRVNAVAPGFIEVDSHVNPVTEEYASAVGDTPLGRRGKPSDIATAVLWLSGGDAEWVTGTVLRVDGGSSTGAWHLPLHWDALEQGEIA